MRYFIIEIDQNIYLAQAPDMVVDNIFKHRKEFLSWLFDKNNNHGLWVIQNGKKYGVMYDAKDFIEYLNAYVIKSKEKAKISEIDFAGDKKDFITIDF